MPSLAVPIWDVLGNEVDSAHGLSKRSPITPFGKKKIPIGPILNKSVYPFLFIAQLG